MIKPKFKPWRRRAEEWQKILRAPSEEAACAAVAKAIERGELKAGLTDMAIMQSERVWNGCGRPYYKVWPRMVDAMGQISLEFDATYLKLPFPTISVMLPVNHELSRGVGTAIMAALVTRDTLALTPEDMQRNTPEVPIHVLEAQVQMNQSKIKKQEDRKGKEWLAELNILYSLPCDPKGVMSMDSCEIFRDETAEECLEDLHNTEPEGVDGVETRLRTHIFKVVVAVAMFGVENHELIMPDIHREILTIKAKNKPQKIAEQLRIERELKKCRGWRVGSEIDLPRPSVIRQGTPAEWGGTELEYGHMRSGHMRMQPCGKNNKDRKLIFVAPTVVRPDLPIRTTHGYRIPDKVLAKRTR